MQLFETLFLLCLGLMFVSVQRADWQVASHILLLTGLVLILLNSILESWRWPLLLAYPGFLLLAWFILTHVRTPAAASMTLGALAILPTLLAVLLLKGLPLAALPLPRGSYPVAVQELHVEDTSRMENHAGSSPLTRTLYVKIWYPGNAGEIDESKAVGLWEEISQQPQFKPLGMLLGFLTGIKTHSYLNLAVASSSTPFPVLIYNHAIVSYPSENSLLLEELASHGYIIFSISHVNQMEAYRNMAVSPGDTSKTDSKTLLARLDAAPTEQEKARVGLEYFRTAVATNAIVESRVQDMQYLLHYLQHGASVPESIRPVLAQADFSRLGALGHSLGGAVSGEFCKLDHACRAATNLDGGSFGLRTDTALQTPYLMISSTAGASMNEYQRLHAQNAYYDFVFHATRHGDFTDQASVMPLLKWLRFLGKADAHELLVWKNRLVLAFFDCYLKGAGDVAALVSSSGLFDSRLKNTGRDRVETAK